MIQVRPAVPDDDTAVQAVEAAATATLHEMYRPNQAALANKARLTSRLKRLVAIVDGQVAGTVRYFVENHSVRVIGLGVFPDFRRRGVARALLQFLEVAGKEEGAGRLGLFTVKQTGNAEVFTRLGFRVVAERKDEFSESDTHAALIDVEMQKQLVDDAQNNRRQGTLCADPHR